MDDFYLQTRATSDKQYLPLHWRSAKDTRRRPKSFLLYSIKY